MVSAEYIRVGSGSAHAVEAIERTTGGHHVDLVTHEARSHPEDYLYDALESHSGDDDVDWEYVEQCGCGGPLVRTPVD